MDKTFKLTTKLVTKDKEDQVTLSYSKEFWVGVGFRKNMNNVDMIAYYEVYEVWEVYDLWATSESKPDVEKSQNM